MEIRFLGATGTVTGSRFLVTAGDTHVLVDCGLFQGVKALRQRNWRPPPVDVETLDAVVLTHAHVDHSGYLPRLVKEGFRGPVFCTAPTRALCGILLPDAGYLQEEAARLANERGFSRHAPALALYTQADARESLRYLESVAPGREIRVGNLEITLRPAGHILGASSAVVRAGGCSVLISGDLGRDDDLLMRPPEPPPDVDYVLMESTYGDRLHPPADPVEAIAEVADRTLRRGGVLLVPAFAVGRSQTMLYCLQQAFDRGLAPRAPIYLDSPMSRDVTDLYDDFADWHRLSVRDCHRIFGGVHIVNKPQESMALDERPGPMVIVSASGMLTGGRILHHLAALGGNPDNTLVLPGFQAPGTRGAKIADGARSVKIHGRYVPVNAEVVQLEMFSAHADQDGLVRWLGRMPHRPREVLLVHGEPAASDALRLRIEEELGWPARAPEHLETLALN